MIGVEWHKALAEALDAEITSPDFFLWLRVKAEQATTGPTRGQLDVVVHQVQTWLNSLNVSHAKDADGRFPTAKHSVGKVEIEVTAVPKKPEARGISNIVVGNPLPPSAHWN